MRLLLIRHGQTPGNVLGQLDTAHPGPELTELGRRQAQALTTTLEQERLDALYASTLVRTQLTARPLARARTLDVDIRPGLHEIEAGSLELRSDRDSIRAYLETVFAWGDGRFDAEIASIAASGAQTAAAFSHGAAIRVWVARRASNIGPAFATENALDNTGVVALQGSPSTGWTLTEWAGRSVPEIPSDT